MHSKTQAFDVTCPKCWEEALLTLKPWLLLGGGILAVGGIVLAFADGMMAPRPQSGVSPATSTTETWRESPDRPSRLDDRPRPPSTQR